MQIDINEHQQIRLKDVFEPIELISTNDEALIICARDGGFEIGIQDTGAKLPSGERSFAWYKISSGTIEPLIMTAKEDD